MLDDIAPEHHTVISAAIFRDLHKQEILLGVRKATPLVQRFPGVLSTPTMGLPSRLFKILDETTDTERPGVYPVGSQELVQVGRGGYLASEAAYALESLFARKLGLAAPLAAGRLYAQARLIIKSCDDVADPLGTQRANRTSMLTYEVVMEDGSEQVPDETESYSTLMWVPIELAHRAITTRDALVVSDRLNPFEVCASGLCLRSIAGVLADSLRR
ncbi:hypothetical protein [Micromonospora vulcania]|uniref:Nudix hydrolase domain-containing protein n=1 Tax=Micromonospora vulcania TaxID=1441873 RepID=A0ABW1HA53_9ACTN